MTLAEIPDYLREGLALHALLAQTFGIAPGDLYVSPNTTGAGYRVIGRQGELEYQIGVNAPHHCLAAFTAAWQRAADAWNAAPMLDRAALVEASFARQRAPDLIAAMSARGFCSPDGLLGGASARADEPAAATPAGRVRN